MNIGPIHLANPVILAPMAGVTDQPFRLLVKEMGCGLVYTEMISSKGLVYQNEHTHNLLKIDDRERPVAVQLFGSDPAAMAQAAQLVEAAGADIVDINMGCPTPKITKNGEGAALMRSPQLAFDIMAGVTAAVGVPVTVKIRKGWDDNSVNAVEMAMLAQRAGIAAVSVHGRTREQFYSGHADWGIIKAVKGAVSIPVVGNGDVRTPQGAARLLAETGCDGVMVGRAAQGNPWLFRQIVRYLATGQAETGPAVHERIAMALRHLDMLIVHKGEHVAIREMRSHAAWYTKGLPHSAELRLRFNKAESRQHFREILAEFR